MRSSNWCRTCLCFTLWCLIEAQTKESLIVTIPGQGKVRGKEVLVTRAQKSLAYLGIPFARPPLMKLRFQPPVTRKLPSWNDVRDMTQFAPACLQNKEKLKEHDYLYEQIILDEDIQFSEDCLYLNIFVPDGNPPSEGWPVMVWFHPGDFNVGTTATWDGSVLAVKQKVVIVTAAYRLNIFGFLALADGTSPGNLGLLDQIAALDWVNNKIAVFNGSNRNICIFGQGAGGISVGLHVLSPLSAGKFHRAIAMSGNAFVPNTIKSIKRQEDAALMIVSEYDCTKASLYICLQNIGGETLLRLASEYNVWGPVVDAEIYNVTHSFLPKHPIDILEEGSFNKVQFLVGYTNMEDGKKFSDTYKNTENGISLYMFKKLISDTIETEIQELISEENDTNINTEHIVDTVTFFYSFEPEAADDILLRQRYMDFKTEKEYASGAYQQATKLSKYNSTYFYRFDYKPQKNIIDIPDWVQVPHGLELPFVWGMPYWINLPNQNKWINADKKIVDYIMALWTNFAKFSNPVQNNFNIKWDQFDSKNPTIMIINRGFNLEDVSTKFDFKKFSFWNDYYPKVVEVSKISCNVTNISSNDVKPCLTVFVFTALFWILNFNDSKVFGHL